MMSILFAQSYERKKIGRWRLYTRIGKGIVGVKNERKDYKIEIKYPIYLVHVKEANKSLQSSMSQEIFKQRTRSAKRYERR